jgi:hypothetical protein
VVAVLGIAGSSAAVRLELETEAGIGDGGPKGNRAVRS